MFSSIKIVAATVGCAAALAAAGTAIASQVATARTVGVSPGAGIPRCTAQHLSGGLHGSQAGLGNRGFILTLTNTSNSSCSVDGYPGLGLQNSRHHAVPSHTHWGGTYFAPDPGRHLIVLSPGETVSADFAYFSGTGGSSDSVATYLEITPPNAVKFLTVKLPGAPLRIDHGNLFVTAMARHTPYNT